MYSVRLLILCLVFITVNANTREMQYDEVTGHLSSTREEVLAERTRHKKRFAEMLKDFQSKIDNHKSGVAPLSGPQVQYYEKKIKVYTHKLKELDLDKDPRFVDRLMAREVHLHEHTKRRVLERTADEL